jgi:hypothetical protein
MAITGSTANVQILIDTPTRTVAKFLYHTATGVDETDALKVNVATLAYGAHTLVLRDTTPVVIPGAVVTGATSNASAYVVDWQRATNTVLVTSLTGNTAFADNEVLTFTFGSTTATVNSAASGAFATPVRNLDITSIWYSIAPNNMVVELEFGGAYANSTVYYSTAMLLAGSGYFGKNALPAQVDNAVLNPTGNFYISTHNAQNKASYTVIVEFRKTTGFAAVPGY